MRKFLPFTFSLSIITILLNFMLIIDFIIKNYTHENDFLYLVLILIWISSQTSFYCYSIYKNKVANGKKSVKKIFYTILIENWFDLLFVFLAFFEGISAVQNPFTNFKVIIAWIIITLLIIGGGFIESKKFETAKY